MGSVRLRETLYEQLTERARFEHRSVSSMAALLLERALGGPTTVAEPSGPSPETALTEPDQGTGHSAHPLSVQAPGSVSAGPDGEASAKRAGSRRIRTATCPHRITPDAYCPRCDT